MIRWAHQIKAEPKAEGDSLCSMEIEPGNGQVKLTNTHSVDREGSRLVEAVSGGWPQVNSSLKSLLEIGPSAVRTRFAAGAG